ncbi:hypothetical protein AB0N05_21670 [Nocardia sp. NPDC051030]|uniref:hypothetical protein n=1 Tax=Nocardia sp. NPDC051030 TaxID=3155162 RepID=UPI00341C65F7
MKRQTLGMLLAVAVVSAGLIAVGCSSTIDGHGIANNADVTAYRSSVASASTSAAAAATARMNTVCSTFFSAAIEASFKLDAVKKRADEHAPAEVALPTLTDAATALKSAGTKVADALTNTPVPADFKSALTEYSQAATAFSTQLTNLALGTSNEDAFMSAQTRYSNAKTAALTACP